MKLVIIPVLCYHTPVIARKVLNNRVVVKLDIPATSGTAMICKLYLSHRVQRTLIERLDFNFDDACGKSKDFLDSKELTAISSVSLRIFICTGTMIQL